MVKIDSSTEYFEKVAIARSIIPYGRNKNRLIRDMNRGGVGLVFITDGTLDISNVRGIMPLNDVSQEQFIEMIDSKAVDELTSKVDKIYHVPSKQWVTWQKFSELENIGWEDYMKRHDETNSRR